MKSISVMDKLTDGPLKYVRDTIKSQLGASPWALKWMSGITKGTSRERKAEAKKREKILDIKLCLLHNLVYGRAIRYSDRWKD